MVTAMITVPDGMIELWQAEAAGRYDHPVEIAGMPRLVQQRYIDNGNRSAEPVEGPQRGRYRTVHCRVHNRLEILTG